MTNHPRDMVHVTRFCDNHEEPLRQDDFGIEYCPACGFVPNDEETDTV